MNLLLTPDQLKPKSFESRQNFSVFTRGRCVSCLRACLGARLLPQPYQYLNLSEGADSVGEGVTKSGRVCRKVPESYARSVPRWATSTLTQRLSSDHIPTEGRGVGLSHY